jgi:hypothetical protein
MAGNEKTSGIGRRRRDQVWPHGLAKTAEKKPEEEMNNSRFVFGLIVGVGLIVVGVVRDTIFPSVIGAALIVLCGVRVAMSVRRSSR